MVNPTKARAYYNEIDPFAAAWLRELIAQNLIAPGDVDERSITDVRADDLSGYTQCHFFAGIGGWSYALRLAGWPDNRAVWTGSCPCQPLSSAGLRKGHADERHLWPAFYHLIAERRPAAVFGEQVASKDGREWLAGVRADLEGVGYAFGAADLCSAGAGAPDIRQRLYWLADSTGKRRGEAGKRRARPEERVGSVRVSDGLEAVGDAAGEGLQGEWREYRPRGERHSGLVGFAMQAGVPQWNGPTVAVKCSDGPRRISAQPDAFPVAHGISSRVGALRGSGNAINPILASQFIAAAEEARGLI